MADILTDAIEHSALNTAQLGATKAEFAFQHIEALVSVVELRFTDFI
jgi:hypothetical protein